MEKYILCLFNNEVLDGNVFSLVNGRLYRYGEDCTHLNDEGIEYKGFETVSELLLYIKNETTADFHYITSNQGRCIIINSENDPGMYSVRFIEVEDQWEIYL